MVMREPAENRKHERQIELVRGRLDRSAASGLQIWVAKWMLVKVVSNIRWRGLVMEGDGGGQ